MKLRLVLWAVIVAILWFLLSLKSTLVFSKQEYTAPTSQLNTLVSAYLKSKQSPLASETEFLLTQKHWKLIVAISAIESQYCKRQLGNNCWGITKVGGGYRAYDSFKEGIKDTNDLIERWQQKGRWLTIEDMNGHYVVPANDNWVKVVNQNLQILNGIEQ